MSRGLGAVERFALDELRQHSGGPRDLAAGYWHAPCGDDGIWHVTRAQMESMRRAIKSLQRKGLVKATITSAPSSGMDAPQLWAHAVSVDGVNA